MYREHGDEVETSLPTWGELLRRAWRAFCVWRWARQHPLATCCYCGDCCYDRDVSRCDACAQQYRAAQVANDAAEATTRRTSEAIAAAQRAYQQQNIQYTHQQYQAMLQNAARQQQLAAQQQNVLAQLGGLGAQLGPLGAGGFEALRRALGHRWPSDPT